MNETPAMVASSFVSTLMMARRNSVAVISASPTGHSLFAHPDVERHLPGALFRLLEAQHQHGERLHGEAPHDAERVSFAEQVHVAAADQDGEQLHADHGVDDAAGGAEFAVRRTEEAGQHAVFGDAIQHAVRTDDGGVDGAGKDQGSHQYDEAMEEQFEERGPDQEHRQAADQVIEVTAARRIRDDHHREERDQGGEDGAVKEDDGAGAFQILQLGRRDLAIHLRQGLEAAHGEQRVPQADQNGEESDVRGDGSLQPAQGVRAVMNGLRGWEAAPDCSPFARWSADTSRSGSPP